MSQNPIPKADKTIREAIAPPPLIALPLMIIGPTLLSRNLSNRRPKSRLDRRQQQGDGANIEAEHLCLSQGEGTVDHRHHLPSYHRGRERPVRHIPRLPTLDGFGLAGHVWALSAAIASAAPAPVAISGAARPVPGRTTPQPSPSATSRSKGA